MSTEERKYFPRQVDLGWIFYDEANKSTYDENGYWEHIRKFGRDDLKNLLSITTEDFSGASLQQAMKQYSVALKNMSLIERARENKLMFAASGTDFSTTEGITFLKEFNRIVQGEDRFIALLDKLINAITIGGKERAPSQAVNFVSYFRSELNEELKRVDVGLLLNLGNESKEWEDFIRTVTKNAASRMLGDFDPEKKNGFFGTPEEYKELKHYVEDNESFYQFVKSYLKIDSVFKEIEKIYTGEKKKRYKNIKINDVFKTTQKDGKKTDNESFERMIGGLVYEFLSSAKLNVTLTEKGAKTSGNTVGSNIGATDTVTVVSWESEIDLDKIEQELQKAMDGPNQKKIALQLNQLDKKLKQNKFSDVFVIHGSDKLYTMGDSFKSFEKTQKVMDIQTLLDEAPFGGRRFGHTLVSLYFNTTPGAVLAENKKDKKSVEDIFRVVVAAVAGKLLFSDWSMIGYESTGAQQIHIFDLDGVYVPLSFILDKMSVAMENLGRDGTYDGPITIGSFNRPKNIEYPAGKKDRYGIGDKTGSEIDFNQYWIYQREKVRSQASFKIKFLKDFKTLVQDIRNEFR